MLRTAQLLLLRPWCHLGYGSCPRQVTLPCLSSLIFMRAEYTTVQRTIIHEYSTLQTPPHLYTNSARLRQSQVSLSQLHTNAQQPNQNTSSPETEKFLIFYRFPLITLARLISRLKIYQTGFTVVGLPMLAAAQSMGYAQGSSLPLATGVTLFAGVMLYVMSHYFRRLVGLMAINDSRDTVRVSHLTFWGRRRDILVPVEDIIPISDLADKPSDIYVKFCRYDSKEYLYYSITYGHVVDAEIFRNVFGSLNY